MFRIKYDGFRMILEESELLARQNCHIHAHSIRYKEEIYIC